MDKTYSPSITLLCKLGSIIVHCDEYLSKDGHELDKQAILSLLQDDDVKDWIENMGKSALLPKKRK